MATPGFGDPAVRKAVADSIAKGSAYPSRPTTFI